MEINRAGRDNDESHPVKACVDFAQVNQTSTDKRLG